MATQEQYNVLQQTTRKLSVKIDVLNKRERIINSFEGVTTSGNISLNADSSHRRSGSITLVVNENTNLLPNPSSDVWIDRRCAIYIGIDSYKGNTVWFNMGRFAMSDINLHIGKDERTISIELKDYMAFLDGTLGGETSRETILNPGDATIAHAIRTVLRELGEIPPERISIQGGNRVIPYRLEQPAGTTIYDVVKELLDMYKGYDFYFDEKGYLIIEQIRDHKYSPIFETFDDSSLDFTLDSTSSLNFSNVRNSIWVWGMQKDDGSQPSWVFTNKYKRKNEAEMYQIKDSEDGDICYVEGASRSYRYTDLGYIGITVSKNVIAPTSPLSYNWTQWRKEGGILHSEEYLHVKFSNDGGESFTADNGTATGNWIGAYVDDIGQNSSNTKDYYWVRTGDSPLAIIEEQNYYIHIRFSGDSKGGRQDGQDMTFKPEWNKWVLLEFNVTPECNVEAIGKRTTVLNDTTVTNEEQARAHSKYELQRTSNFAETVSISLVPLYHLDVNKKIAIKNKKGMNGDYLITSISIPLDISSPMNIDARRVYDSFLG